MELNLQASDSPVRASATVVMLRDGTHGLEVFLLQRHGLSDVLGGAYVFPGGKVDAADTPLAQALDTPHGSLPARLNEPDLAPPEAAAIHVAALRELFEETGVLIAQPSDPAVARRASALLREGLAFEHVVTSLSLRLSANDLQPWSRWITPAVGGVIRKRFDTRFFLARVPEGQQPAHDGREATQSCWLAPREALDQYWSGAIELAPPQIMSLAHLSRYGTVDEALAAARRRPPPLVHPEPFEEAGRRVICYPGDSRHSVRERALPGPTRLHYVNRRFEPAGGFEALFADS